MPIGALPTGIVAATILFEVLITDTVLSFSFATYAWLPSGAIKILIGALPTVTAETALVTVLIIDTVLLLPKYPSATYTRLPSGVTATPLGPLPIGMVNITMLLAVLITDNVLS